jgi:periplasmic divalent cation tolerance protein
MSSIYTWEGETCEEDEVLLMIKTRADLFDALSAVIAKEHPYDVPEIVAVSLAAGSASYLNWIDQVTRKA